MGKAVALPPQIPGHVIILHTSIYVSVQCAKIGKYVGKNEGNRKIYFKVCFPFQMEYSLKEPTECSKISKHIDYTLITLFYHF